MCARISNSLHAAGKDEPVALLFVLVTMLAKRESLIFGEVPSNASIIS